MSMRIVKRGFTLIELLVVIAIIGILAAILIPNILDAIDEAKKTQDADNIKGLLKAFIQGTAKSKPVPGAVGYQFWLALYVGDAGGKPLDKDDVYLTPGDAAYLKCPMDDLNDKAATEQAVLDAYESGSLNDLGVENCSYAGPKAGVMRKKKKLSGYIVGATGARDNLGFFDGGFNAVKGNLEVQFYEYEKLATDWGGNWQKDMDEPDWADDHLKWLEPLPAS